MHGRTKRFNLGDVKRDIGVYSPEHQEILLTIYGYWMKRLHGDKAEIQALLQTDWTTWGRVLRGVYRKDDGHKIDSWIAKCAMPALQIIRGDAAGTFVHTITTRKIHSFLDYARDTGSMASILGPTGSGKSEAVLEWARINNHGDSIYLDCPSLNGMRPLLEELARVTGGSTQRSSAEMARAIEQALGKRNILIVDEAQRLLPSTPSRRATGPLDFLRRLHQVRGVMIAFVSTDVFDETSQPEAVRKYMAQLYRRIGMPLVLPTRTPKSETFQIVEAFREDPPGDLLPLAHRIANMDGRIGLLFTLLDQAKELAEAGGHALCRQDLQQALDTRMSRGVWPRLCPDCRWTGIPEEDAKQDVCPDCGGMLLD